MLVIIMTQYLVTLHGDDQGVTIDGIEGLVSYGMWQGLNNQRLCVTPSFLMAERLGYGVLLVRKGGEIMWEMMPAHVPPTHTAILAIGLFG